MGFIRRGNSVCISVGAKLHELQAAKIENFLQMEQQKKLMICLFI